MTILSLNVCVFSKCTLQSYFVYCLLVAEVECCACLVIVACLHTTLASPFHHCFRKLDIIKIMFSVMNKGLQANVN